MKLQENTIRASYLSSYNDCARRGAASMFPLTISDAGYALNHGKQNIGAAIGTGSHASLEYTLRKKIDAGNTGYDDEAESAAISALHKETLDGVLFDSITANMNQAEKQVVRNSRLLRSQVTPLIQPTDVEVEFSANYRGMNILGHIDVLEDERGGDLKTGKFSKMNAPQYGTYLMLVESSGRKIKSFREFWIKTVALDKHAPPPVIEEYEIGLAKEMAEKRLDYVIDDYQAFLEDGNPKHFRANPSSMLCDPKYCKAFGTKWCNEHKGVK
jgi:PD-(D/E)XK nuclease superfamily